MTAEKTIPPVPAGCWFLSGATAGGKTEVGLPLAERLGAEIVSLDSMAVYRGMDIGTAKPSRQQRERVPHHLIDIVDPHEDFSLARYARAAHEAADTIRARERTVLFVGGTPLYLKALLRGMFDGPAADAGIRCRLRDDARHREPTWLHRRLRQVDPVSAARLHPNDTKRLVRALEVFEVTGQPMADWQQQFARARRPAHGRVFVLDWERDELRRRIEKRVDAMFAAGLVDEVRRLSEVGKPISHTASQAVGYRQVLEHLDGKRDLVETVSRVKTATLRLAKRQRTWFRSLAECRNVPRAESDDAMAVVEYIVRAGRSVTTE